MIYVEALKEYTGNGPSIFLGGGITGTSDWQTDIVGYLKYLVKPDLVVLNPRRKNFPIDDPTASFKQIEWEFNMLQKSSAILFWFCKETLCPIVLYELGAHIKDQKPIFIGMDPEYQRRQDVEIQTKLVRDGVDIKYNLKELALQVIQWNQQLITTG